MALYELNGDAISRLEGTSFADHGIKERRDLQRLLKRTIECVAPGTMVVAEEFGDWEDSRRRVDLLCLDDEANLVVVELKRGEDGGHMELQALRYAAMVSAMTFPKLVEAHARYLKRPTAEAEAQILEFLGWDAPDEELFGRDVRIVLVSGEFSKELTTSVMWLNERSLDITCVRLSPHRQGDKVILNIETIIPLPEAGDYLVRMKEKAAEVREAMKEKAPWSGFWFVNVGEHQHRCWEDCRQHGYVAADGKAKYTDQIRQLKPGDKLFAYLNGHGYVGYGEVLAEAVPHRDFVLAGTGKKLAEQILQRPPTPDRLTDGSLLQYCVAVRWGKTLGRADAVKAKSRRRVACRLTGAWLVDQLRKAFEVPEPPQPTVKTAPPNSAADGPDRPPAEPSVMLPALEPSPRRSR